MDKNVCNNGYTECFLKDIRRRSSLLWRSNKVSSCIEKGKKSGSTQSLDEKSISTLNPSELGPFNKVIVDDLLEGSW